MGIEKQLEYVKQNAVMLTQKYDGKYVVVSDNLEEKSFASLDMAYSYGIDNLGAGNFFLQQFNSHASQLHIVNQTITSV